MVLPFISEELFHFVGHAAPDDHEKNYSVLKDVLEDGCISHAPHANDWGAVSYSLDLSAHLHTEKLLIPTVTCFCDIPFDSLPLHTRKYGAFGLALTRHHLVQFGARPVTYVPTRSDDAHSSRGGGSALLSSLEASFRGLISQLADENVTGAGGTMNPTKTPTTPTEAIEHLERTLALEVLAFVKPYDSLLDQADPRYYYSEREWRKFGNMRFDPTDVTRVVVRPEFVACARQDFPELSSCIFASPS